MTWTKLGAEFFGSEHMFTVDRDARLVHIEAMTWSNAQHTDGHIPRNALLRRITDSPDPLGAAAQNVEAGAWEVTDKGWRIITFLDDQPTAAKVEAEAQANRIRSRRARLHGHGDHSECLDNCRAKQGGVPRHVPRDARVTNAVSVGVSAKARPSVRPTAREDGKDGAAPALADARPATPQKPKAADHKNADGSRFRVAVDEGDEHTELTMQSVPGTPKAWAAEILAQVEVSRSLVRAITSMAEGHGCKGTVVPVPLCRVWLDEEEPALVVTIGSDEPVDPWVSNLHRLADELAEAATADPDDVYGAA
jgi:hypothetical protein